MMSTIVNNGNVQGLVNGNESVIPAVPDPNRTNPTTYNSADIKPLAGADRVKTLQYPVNGNNNHYVRFFINIVEESRLLVDKMVETTGPVDLSDQDRAFRNQTSQEAITAGATVGGALLGAKAGIAVRQFFVNRLGAGSVGTQIATGAAATIAGGAAGAKIGSASGEIITDTLKITNKLMRLAANITLYTPPTVRTSYNFSYDMPEDLLVALSQSDNFEALKAGLGSMVSPLTGTFSELGENTQQSLQTLGKFGRILAAKASPTVSMLSRTAMNNKKDVMFKYVGNRQFNFDYTFAAKNPAEAKVIDDIIFMFKYFAHPEMLPGYGNFLYLYPAEFDIEYGMVRDNPHVLPSYQERNPYLNKISSCVLTAIDVNYSTGNSFQSLEKGEPLVVSMSLVFREIETLHRDRIGKGY